ncbi:MAG: cache domain-containing protein [Pseudomonadota bacterium]|jgi:methyl-accepting chemotaxis protein
MNFFYTLWALSLVALTSLSLPVTALAEPNTSHLAVPAALIGSDGRFGPDAQVALGAYRGMVEEHVDGVIRTLRVLTNTSEARSGSWEQIKPLLLRYSNDLPTDATAWFVTPDGNYSVTDGASTEHHNLRDRPYFPILMSGKEVFGDLVISHSTGHRSVIIAAPIISSQTSKIIGGLGVSLRVRLLSELVDKHLGLSDKEYFYALERDTKIALHRKADRMFKTPSDVGDEALGEQFKRELTDNSGSFEYTLHGKNISAIYQRSPELGWYFFLAREIDPA